MTNTGSLILISGKLSTIQKPKEKRPKDQVRAGRERVSWRGNVCTAQTCPSIFKKSRDSRDSKKEKGRGKSRRKDKSKDGDESKKVGSRRKGNGRGKKSGVKYFLYFQMGLEDSDPELLPSLEDVEKARGKPPRREKHKSKN